MTPARKKALQTRIEVIVVVVASIAGTAAGIHFGTSAALKKATTPPPAEQMKE